MTGFSTLPHRGAALRAFSCALLLMAGAACDGDGVGPTPLALPTDAPGTPPLDTVPAAPVDSTVPPPAPVDSTVPPPGDSGAVPPPPDSTLPPPEDSIPTDGAGALLPGIVFGTFHMPNSYLSSVHTGTLYGGEVSPSNILTLLSQARAKGARVIVKLSMGRERFVLNDDGTFSVTKWKALVDRYKSINLAPYLADGTIVGHYMIDEPHRASKWGGKVVSQATLEAMAAHSKKNWPGMATFVRVVPSWLASAPVNYVHLDAGWAQYTVDKGDAARWVAAEVAAAKSKGLGLAVGMNVLDGGNGSSRIPGWTSGRWAMSANEIRTYGAAMLAQSHACAFYMWMHDAGYYARTDIKSAMAAVSLKARNHAKTSCRQ
jgi:hypothetical protein